MAYHKGDIEFLTSFPGEVIQIVRIVRGGGLGLTGGGLSLTGSGFGFAGSVTCFAGGGLSLTGSGFGFAGGGGIVEALKEHLKRGPHPDHRRHGGGDVGDDRDGHQSVQHTVSSFLEFVIWSRAYA